jgi:hypothetical protein
MKERIPPKAILLKYLVRPRKQMTVFVSLVSIFQHEYIIPRKYILCEILFHAHKGLKLIAHKSLKKN